MPPTLLTTFPPAARQFAAAHQDLVVKSVSGKHPGTRRWCCPPPASARTRTSPGSAAGPTLLQQHIRKAADIRLTCVGDQLFAARKKAEPDEVDSRFTHHGTWEPVEVPDAVHRAVLHYMSTAQLAYGAFDFAEDRDGTWWFLECNQWGQFGFVQLETDQPIAQAIADWLAVKSALERGGTCPEGTAIRPGLPPSGYLLTTFAITMNSPISTSTPPTRKDAAQPRPATRAAHTPQPNSATILKPRATSTALSSLHHSRRRRAARRSSAPSRPPAAIRSASNAPRSR